MVSKRNSVNCCREYFQEKNVNFQCIGFVCTHMPQGPLPGVSSPLPQRVSQESNSGPGT